MNKKNAKYVEKNIEATPLKETGIFKVSKKKLVDIAGLAQNRSFAEEIELLEDFRCKKINFFKRNPLLFLNLVLKVIKY